MKNKTTYNLTLSGICLAISIVMPYVFHFAGQQSGTMFLPLFWGVALAGLLLPTTNAIMVAILAPILSHILSGMPPVPMLYFMIIELCVYAFSLSKITTKLIIPIRVAASLALSRSVYIICLLIAAQFFSIPFAAPTILVGNIAISVVGILIQIIILPILYNLYQKVVKQ